MLIRWFQHLLCKARGQPLCFYNPETARRGRWCTEKLMGKGEGEEKKAEAASENWPLLNHPHQAQLLFCSQSLFWFALWTVLSPYYYLIKGRALTGLLAEFLFIFNSNKKLVGKYINCVANQLSWTGSTCWSTNQICQSSHGNSNCIWYSSTVTKLSYSTAATPPVLFVKQTQMVCPIHFLLTIK